MLKKSKRLKIQNGSIQILDKIKAEYHRVNKPIRIKVSENRDKNIFSIGKHIILNGHEPVKKGSLIQVKLKLKNRFKNSFSDERRPNQGKKIIGIGQVLRILEIRNKRYRMLIHLLDLCTP